MLALDAVEVPGEVKTPHALVARDGSHDSAQVRLQAWGGEYGVEIMKRNG